MVNFHTRHPHTSHKMMDLNMSFQIKLFVNFGDLVRYKLNCPKREILNKFFENNPNLLIIPSDKNKSVTITDKNKYCEKFDSNNKCSECKDGYSLQFDSLFNYCTPLKCDDTPLFKIYMKN